MMSKTILGVPESMTRDAYTSLFKAVGIDPYNTLELRLHANGVHATVFALDEKGFKIYNAQSDGFLKHEIYIPVEG